jgi:hypothetical protein
MSTRCLAFALISSATLLGCDTPSSGSSASAAKTSSAASAKPATSAAASAPAPSAAGSAAASPAKAALGNPGEGFATIEDAVAAIGDAIASEDLKAFDVGKPSKALLDAAFTGCKESADLAKAMDMKPSVQAGLALVKGKRPLKLVKHGEGQAIELKKGEGYADCTASSDLKLRVFGFMLNDAEGNEAFGDGSMGVSLFPLGEPPRIYVGAPK